MIKSPPFARIVPLLHSIRWLPLKFKVSFKISLLTYETLSGKRPVYLLNICLDAPIPFTDIEQRNHSVIPRVQTITGARAFHSCTPLFGRTSHSLSMQPLQLKPSGSVSSRMSSTWPFPRRHQHTQWPVDVMELLHQFCCWSLIRLSCHWALLRQDYWHNRKLIDGSINVFQH